MKRFVIVLSLITLLAMIFSCFPAVAQSIHIPHQNPATAKDSPGLASLLLFYGNVFELASMSQYKDSQSMLNELEHADIPDELRYLLNRYNTLSLQLLTTLDNLESLLDDASNLLAHNQVSDAKQKLNEAEAAVYSAQLLLGDIEAATNILSDKVGIAAALAGSEIRQAHDRLQEMLHRVRQLFNKLNQLRESITERREIQAVQLIATELSLSITPASAFVGDSITTSGRLTSNGSPLVNRKLTVILDKKPLGMTTDPDGSYVTDIAIPYKYVSTMNLCAEYAPYGDDIGIYLGCKSPLVLVNTSFYPTLLEVSVPETAYPGLPISVSGQVGSTHGQPERTIKVLLDNNQLAEETIQGEFNIQITPPPRILTGKHSLTVVAPPQGRYAGTSKSLPINISVLPIRTEMQIPLLTIIPKTIRISGNVYHGLTPVEDAKVSLTFKETTTTVRTSTDGSFTTTIEAPFDLSLVGPQELITTIEPVEPWYASLETRRRISTINPANIGVMLAACTFLGLLVLQRGRTRPPRPREEKVTPQAKLPELSSVTPPGLKYEFTGIKGKILSAYLNGLGTVEQVTGIPLMPNTTLREFVNAASPLLPSAIKPFAELTAIAEYTLYSSHKPDENVAAKAERLAGIIKEELHNGAA